MLAGIPLDSGSAVARRQRGRSEKTSRRPASPTCRPNTPTRRAPPPQAPGGPACCPRAPSSPCSPFAASTTCAPASERARTYSPRARSSLSMTRTEAAMMSHSVWGAEATSTMVRDRCAARQFGCRRAPARPPPPAPAAQAATSRARPARRRRSARQPRPRGRRRERSGADHRRAPARARAGARRAREVRSGPRARLHARARARVARDPAGHDHRLQTTAARRTHGLHGEHLGDRLLEAGAHVPTRRTTRHALTLHVLRDEGLHPGEREVEAALVDHRARDPERARVAFPRELIHARARPRAGEGTLATLSKASPAASSSVRPSSLNCP